MIVDEDNNVVGAATRKEMRENNLWHRASYIFIVTDEAHGQKLLVQKRTMKKDYCPGYFDLATGGVVGEGEDDDLSALREIEEEIGIKNAALQKIKVIKCGDQKNRIFCNIYLLKDFNPGACPLTLQADEVDEVQYWSREFTEL